MEWNDWLDGGKKDKKNPLNEEFGIDPNSLNQEQEDSVDELVNAVPIPPEFEDVKLTDEDLQVMVDNAGKLNFLNRAILQECMKGVGLGEAGSYLGYLAAFCFNLGKKSRET